MYNQNHSKRFRYVFNSDNSWKSMSEQVGAGLTRLEQI